MTIRFRRFFFAVALLLACVSCGASRPASLAPGQQGGPDPLEVLTAEALFQRGHESANRGDTVRAEQYLQLALEKGYDRGRALPVLLNVCLSSGRLRSALNYAEPELRLRPDDAELRYLVASIHWGLGQRHEARDELKQLLRVEPKQAAALYLLGVIEADDFGQDNSAREYFQSYLAAAPRGKHAAEIRNRLSGLDAQRAVASRTDSPASAAGEKRMPRYEPYVPDAGIAAEREPSPMASPLHSADGGWR
jgi:tetratricopeptide (TPR) repeat protein